MTYVVPGPDLVPKLPRFDLSDADLAERGAVCMAGSRTPSFPCWVTQTDCDVGSSVLLLNPSSHKVANSYRGCHAIFVREGARVRYRDQVPPVFTPPLRSLRRFNGEAMLVDAALSEAGHSDEGIRKLSCNPLIETIRAHNAIRGCFAAKIERS